MDFHYSRHLPGQRFLLFVVAFLCAVYTPAKAQSTDEESVEEKYINWYNKDDSANSVPGMSTDRAYNELLKDKKSKTIVVAVIDGGVDINDKDLKGKIWTNEKEIPGNGIDDDHNGYVDDVHGWNFLGNAKGENIEHETLELTRLYKMYSDRFGGKTKKQISDLDKYDYAEYEKITDAYLKELLKVKENQKLYTRFLDAYNNADSTIREYLKKDTYTMSELKAVKSYSNDVNDAAAMLIVLDESNLNKHELEKLKKHEDDQIAYDLNPDYDPRKDIIDDDPDKLNDITYGNNNVIGPNPSHGTFVSGVIAANREDPLKVNGVADNVLIMPIRAIPDGDEYDKDVANAIRYAVDNGAQIINMSFGKAYSPQKQLVDEAILYAESKGVLLIVAAGNDSKNLDKVPDYPSPVLINGKEVANFITVGAISLNQNKNFVSSFSNYGKKTVDLFAPGEDIYGLKPHNKYELGDGTSYAAPMVTGAAAMLKSYFPLLSAQQLKNIIVQSGINYKKRRVYKPTEKGKGKKIKFAKLSSSGTELNIYNAVKMAEQVPGKAAK